MLGTIPGKFHDYFWVPIVRPLVGGVLIYDLFVGDALHSRGLGTAEQDEQKVDRPPDEHAST